MNFRKGNYFLSTESPARLLIVVGMMIILFTVIVAALFNSPQAVQVLPIVTGLIGTIMGYYFGSNQVPPTTPPSPLPLEKDGEDLNNINATHTV